jgi:hypothetical protein
MIEKRILTVDVNKRRDGDIVKTHKSLGPTLETKAYPSN